MGLCLIASSNRIDESVVGGGAYTAGLPLANIKTKELDEVARSTNLTFANTKFYFQLAKARPINFIAIVAHNFSSSATYRITAYSDAGMTALLYDSGILPVWVRIKQTEQMNWEDENFWTGLPTSEDLEGITNSLAHVMGITVARYWQVEFFDASNTAGYIEFGRVFVSTAWQPQNNMAYGASMGIETDTKVKRLMGGSKDIEACPNYRVTRITFKDLGIYEAFVSLFDLYRKTGLDSEVFFMYDVDDTVLRHRRSYIGTFRKLSPIEHATAVTAGTAIDIEETL